MKKRLMCLLICVMIGSVQAVIIDDFSDTSLTEYTITAILQNGGPDTYQVQSPSGSLEIVTTVNTAEDQYAIIYNGLKLPVGAELQTDISRTADSQDIGLYVGGTTPQTAVRRDYVAVYARNNGQVFSRGFDGTTEYGLTGGGTPVLQALFIARTGTNTFEAGYYEGGVRNIITTRNPAFANEADVVGFYADVRATGTNGNADNLRIVSSPYSPSVEQADGDSGVDVTLVWSAAVDPLGTYAVDPEIVDQYVFLSGDDIASDPNLYYVGAVGDPGTTDPLSSLLVENLAYETAYNWAVVEVFDGHTQSLVLGVSTLADVDPNNTVGPAWSFTTVSEQPSVSGISPAYIVVDAADDPDVVLTATAFNVDSYQWYREGDPDPLTEGAKYVGVQSNTMTIVDVDQADEGYYYCYVENTAGNDTSESARVLTRRLMSYYPFETTGVVDGNSVTPDTISGYDAVLLAEGGQAAPSLADANQLDASTGFYLRLDNADSATDPNGQYAQLPAGVIDYEDITVSAWVHPKGGTIWGRLFDFGNGTVDYFFMTPDNGSGALRFATRIDNGSEQQLSGAWLPSNVWHHVAVTISGDTGRLYRNGELVATNTGMTIDPMDVGAVLNYIGKSQYEVDPEFNGLIDELKIYNYAMTTEEIAQDYLAIEGGWVCNNEVEALPYDYNDDCMVNLEDFAVFAATWLDSNRIYAQ